MFLGCCNGPGFDAGFSAFLCNLEDDGCAPPCWCIGYADLTSLGYDSDRDWLLVIPSPFGLGAAGSANKAIQYLDFRACNAIDGMTPQDLLDAPTSTGIFADAGTLPTTAYGSVTQGWLDVFKKSGDDDYRIYGWTSWNTDPSANRYIRIWSVKYDGSDLREDLIYHYANLATPGDEEQFGGITMSSDGDITAMTAGFSPSQLNAWVNGSSTLSIDQTSLGGFDIERGTAVGATVGGGVVVLHSVFGLIAGTDPDSDTVYFAFTKDAVTYEFAAVAMHWSDKFGGLMVLWVYYGTDTPPSRSYVTLATSTLAPGNILSQDGVTAYDCGFAPGVIYGLWPGWPPFTNFCSLPRPTEFEPAIVTPEPPTCDDIYSGCDFATQPLEVTDSFATDCSFTDSGIFKEWNGSVGNGSWTLANVTTIDPALVLCVSNDIDGWMNVLVDYSSAPFGGGGETFQDQYDAVVAANSDAGITKAYRIETVAESFKNEYWLVATAAKLACIDGLIYLIERHYITLEFGFAWDSGLMDWVLSSVSGPSCIDSYEDPTDVIHRYPAKLFPDCSTILDPGGAAVEFTMVTLFTYDECGTPSDAGLQVIAYIDAPP